MLPCDSSTFTALGDMKIINYIKAGARENKVVSTTFRVQLPRDRSVFAEFSPLLRTILPQRKPICGEKVESASDNLKFLQR